MMDDETYKWLLAKPHLEPAFTGGLIDELTDADIMHALVTCALELDSAARLSSSLKRAKPYHEAAALIVQAIRVLEAPKAMGPIEEWGATTTLHIEPGEVSPIRDDDVEIED